MVALNSLINSSHTTWNILFVLSDATATFGIWDEHVPCRCCNHKQNWVFILSPLGGTWISSVWQMEIITQGPNCYISWMLTRMLSPFQFYIFIMGWAFFPLTCKVPAQCVCVTVEIMLTLENYRIVRLEGMTIMQSGCTGFITTAAVLCLHLQMLCSSMPCHV
jgi:hypothetical protein